MICVGAQGFLFMAGCGAEAPGEPRSGAGRSEASSRPLVAVGSVDQLLNAMSPITGYVASGSLEFPRHVGEILLDEGRIWVTTGDRTLYDISIVISGNNISGLKIEREIDLGCGFGNLTPHAGKLWFIQRRCDDGEITLAALDTASGDVTDRVVITTRNNGVASIIADEDYLFVQIVNGFELIRVPTGAPERFEKLDLRPDRDGKSGHGYLGAGGGRLWVMDTDRDQVIEVDPGSFDIVGIQPFSEAGMGEDIIGCRSNAELVYCWESERLYRFDPQSKRVAASWSSDRGQILGVAAHDGSVFVGLRGASAQLDAQSLEKTADIYGVHASNLQVSALP